MTAAEFDACLECGILTYGFLRLHCGDCGHDKLVAFSGKWSGFCPSCGARRMSRTAAHLVDYVIPHVPVRQWVLIWVMRLPMPMPMPMRLLLAAQPKLVTPVTPVLQVVHRVITRHLLRQSGLKPDEADNGAVTLIQRFGSAANLNIHLHGLVLHGVYWRSADGAPRFVELPAATDEALQTVLHKIISRMMKMLSRRGVLVEEEGSTCMALVADNDGDSDEARVLRPPQAAACLYRIASGPRAGQKVLTVQGAMPRQTDFKQALCASIDGFSLHAAVRCGADDRPAVPQVLKSPTQAEQPAECEANCAHHRPVRLSWAKLLKRVFEIDLDYSPNCGGELKIIAAILEQPVIEKFGTRLGLQARAPFCAPARGQVLHARCVPPPL